MFLETDILRILFWEADSSKLPLASSPPSACRIHPPAGSIRISQVDTTGGFCFAFWWHPPSNVSKVRPGTDRRRVDPTRR